MEELIKKAIEKGIDVEELLLSAISKLDPQEGIKIRLELAERYMKECEEYMNKGDAIQASEKAYKVAEEVVKALAEKFNTAEYQQYVKEGRWYTYTLGKVANTLSKSLGNWVSDGWSSGYFLHVWGFHEGKLSVNDISSYVSSVKRMLDEAKKILNQN